MSEAKSQNKMQQVQPNAHPKVVRNLGTINVQMTQNMLLIWLDATIDESSDGCQNTITNFRDAVNTIDMFTDGEECIQFLEEMANEKACMIISGSFGQQIVPRIHNLPQVDSIFIFCSDKTHHEEWAKDWSKIKGVFNEIRLLCEALKRAAEQCEQNSISISIIGGTGSLVEKSGDRLDPSFMYTQIMKEIFLSINFEQRHKDEFIRCCRHALAGNQKQLKYVDDIDQQYDQHSPIWWYTCDSFLYSMLNRALRVMDANMMIKLGFFVKDLHRHIEELHHKQFSGHGSNQTFTLYRGQAMEKEHFDKIVANKGGLISFNCFLSTSHDRSTSLNFAQRSLKNVQLMGVLFVMIIDPTRSSAPFASVVDVGYYGAGEDEVLFSMHTVFRIEEITLIGDHPRLVEVQLTLASDKDNDMCELVDYIREETLPDAEGWYRLGAVLWKMGELAEAQHIYEVLLKQESEDGAKASIYHQLGLMKDERGASAEAIEYYEKSIEIEEKQIPRHELSLAMTYNNLGSAYYSVGDYANARSSYEKALTIRQQLLSPHHPDLAKSYVAIGLVCYGLGDYLKALTYYEKALVIRQQSLPPTHPDLAQSYVGIGNLYYNMNDYPKALSSHEKALTIREQTLPPTHPDLANSYNNIGLVYSSTGDYSKALCSHEKAVSIQQQSLSSTHPDLAGSHNNIGLVYSRMGDYPKALASYKQALAIQRQSLPSTHPDLALSYNNIGFVYFSMGHYQKAFLSYEKALTIQQQTLPSTHPHLANTYDNIGLVYYKMGQYPNALSFYEKTLAIQQQTLPSIHPDLAISYNSIGLIYYYQKDYPTALSLYEKALAIRQQLPSPIHSDLGQTYLGIGDAYRKMGNYPTSFSAYEKALITQKQILHPRDPDLGLIYNNMGLLHEYTTSYWKAKLYVEQAVDLGQRSLPANDTDLRRWRNNLIHINQKS